MCDISLLFLIWTGRWLWGVGGNICTPKTHQMWNTQETRNTTVHAKMAGTLWGSGLTEWRIRWEMKQGKNRALHSIFSFTMSCPIQFRKEKKKRFHAMPLLTNLFFHFLCVCLTLAVYLCSFDDALFIDFPESVLMLLRPLKLALQLCS